MGTCQRHTKKVWTCVYHRDLLATKRKILEHYCWSQIGHKTQTRAHIGYDNPESEAPRALKRGPGGPQKREKEKKREKKKEGRKEKKKGEKKK